MVAERDGMLVDLRRQRDEAAARGDHAESLILNDRIHDIKKAGTPTIDEHPLRYAGITRRIEDVLFRRSLEKRLGGYTLETALEIAEALVGTGVEAGHGQ